jgi:kojibiose phosphorylase
VGCNTLCVPAAPLSASKADGEAPSPCDRRFRLIAFDWDGTAVANRAEDATPVRGPIERLLRAGVPIVVITGTHFGNVDGQLSRAIRGPHKRNLYVATNRGSEVYGFDEASEPVRVFHRAATEAEDRALTAAANALRDELASRAGLDVHVVYDRMNRRKVDLIPLPEWRDPPKSALGDLLAAVEGRLAAAGVGLAQVIALARAAARANGLPDARITSDVKHVEIGLTDKADSVQWMMKELAEARGIGVEEILIGGDEFGPIAGFEGSDSRMLIPESTGATVVSVGPEPGGAPAGVDHIGGGPRRFCELLMAQAARWPVTLPGVPEQRPAWALVEGVFVLAREHEIESLFAIGNGLVGSRGSLAEGSGLSAPATFIAGVFDAAAGSVPGLANAPEWSQVSATVNGSPLRITAGKALIHRRILDMRQGILWRQWRHADDCGRVTRVDGMRLASLADRHLVVQSIAVTPENYSSLVTVEAPALSRSAPMRATSGVGVAIVARSRVEGPAGMWASPPPPEDAGAPERWTLQLDLGKSYRLDRMASVHTSRDSSDPHAAAHTTLARAYDDGIEQVVARHCAAWQARWDASDVVIDGDTQSQRAIRFAAYHLTSCANPDDEHVSIGARALTGAAYKGHVFWDTEIFMLPFFTLTYPEAARALLMYRYHRLPQARARARRFGFRGALFPWESADSGDDVTPSFVLAPDGRVLNIRVGEEEQHISADIAYAVCGYWHASGDVPFLLDAGAEIVLETARFWASRARRGDDGRHHIRGVIGPDEHHVGVDDSAFTNGMAQWNLEAALEIAALVEERWPERWRALAARLGVSAEERAAWRDVAESMYTGLDPATGLIEQFRGYFDLDELDLAALEPRAAPVDVLLGQERVQRSKVIKQADVVMLLHLLWDRFPAAVREANFRYYEPRTSHGSSLSPAIHAAVAARLGDEHLAWRYFRRSMKIDLGDNMGNAAGGVHAGALGALWQAVVLGFAGLSLAGDTPRLSPRLPAAWRGLHFAIQWRGRRIPLDVVNQRPAATPPPAEVHP